VSAASREDRGEHGKLGARRAPGGWRRGSAALLPLLFACSLFHEDAEKNTLSGSPLDELPAHITQLTDFGARADWSPDGRGLVFIDDEAGDVHALDLETRATRNLTRGFRHHGFTRAHHLANGDLILCGAADAEANRFEGVLWVLQRPFDAPPVPLDEPCWEGIAVSRKRLAIAWARSDIDVTSPRVPLHPLISRSEIWTGELAYRDGRPALVKKTLLVERNAVARWAAIEPQDFRPPEEKELIFSAYAYRGGEVMGLDLETGAIRNHSQSPWYEEPEGIFPDGRATLVERDLSVVFLPEGLDIWRLELDESGRFERLTHFNRHRGFGASNPVVSPDGRWIAFQLRIDGRGQGAGEGLLLFDLDQYARGGR
jgi:dipeptidyl aminopeptidase/acylaminoacyl peptidase